MYPTLLTLGELRFHSYTVMMTLAFLIGALGPNWLNNRREKPFPVSPAGGIWIFLGGVAGSKIYWMVQYGDMDDLRYLQFFITGGLVFFGGLLGGIISGAAYLKFVKAPIIPVADMVAPFMALAHGIGRLGCYLNGCCWGRVTQWSLPWAVTFPKGTSPYREQIRQGLIGRDDLRSMPVHPTQMYETTGLVIIFLLLLFIYRKHKHTGVVTLSYFALYGGLRFITEAFRGESARPVLGLFTVSQCIGLALLAFGGLGLLLCHVTVWRNAPETSAPDDEELTATESAREELSPEA